MELRDVRPSVIEVEPDTALAQQYPGGDDGLTLSWSLC